MKDIDKIILSIYILIYAENSREQNATRCVKKIWIHESKILTETKIINIFLSTIR